MMECYNLQSTRLLGLHNTGHIVKNNCVSARNCVNASLLLYHIRRLDDMQGITNMHNDGVG
jgi:hypothetical protein